MASSAEEGQVIGCHTVDEFDKQFQIGIESKKLTLLLHGAHRAVFIAPVFVELAKKFTQALFLKVDVDELKPVAEKWEVEAMPTFIFFKDGKIVHKMVGADKEGLASTIEKHATEVAAA